MSEGLIKDMNIDDIVIIGYATQGGRYKQRLGVIDVVLQDFIVCEIVDHYGKGTGVIEIIHFSEIFEEYKPSAAVQLQVAPVMTAEGNQAVLKDLQGDFMIVDNTVTERKTPLFIRILGIFGVSAFAAVICFGVLAALLS